MAYDEITVKKTNVDGSIGTSTSKIEDGEMSFEQSSTPGPTPPLDDYYTKEQANALFATKDGVSSMTLLGTAIVQSNDSTGAIHIEFTNVDFTKITAKTLLILTYANCFVLGMLSQTGQGRVVGNLVYDTLGNSKLGKVKFEKAYAPDSIFVDTDVIPSFGGLETHPTAYLFCFSVI